MKSFLLATTAVALLAAPAVAQDVRDIEATVSEKTQPVLNGSLDLGGGIAFDDAEIDADLNVGEIAGETTVEVSDQIDSVTGKVMATSTNVTDQVNNGDIRAVAATGINAGNRAADITAAAIGNTMSVVNGVSQ